MTRAEQAQRRQDIVELRLSGIPLRVVAHEMDVSMSTVSRATHMAGINSPRCAADSSYRAREIGRKYQFGATLAAIGFEYGITKQRVSQILISLGIPRRYRIEPLERLEPPRASVWRVVVSCVKRVWGLTRQLYERTLAYS